MTRQQHVVRSDDQSGIGATRALGGCTIFCGHGDYGGVSEGYVHIAHITVEVATDFQRCFVAGTVGWINAVSAGAG
jgi:hypothetical protein